MASTTTTELGLFKPVPGSAEPFRTTDVNGNWDILDTVVAGYEERIVEAEESIEGVIEQFEEDGAAAISTFNTNSAAAITTFNEDGAAAIDTFETNSAAAIDTFEDDAAAALALVDTEAIIDEIVNEGFTLNVDGGTA
jgi:hypothetical protein